MAYTGADSVRVSMPLFHGGGRGSSPTSALQLHFELIGRKRALALNALWHSMLPRLPEWNVYTKHGICYGAIYEGIYYAIAIWSRPVSRQLDDGNTFELRRMAIANDAPKNTASRMMGWMIRELKKSKWTKAISYQDAEVHAGTIYKASGWTSVAVSNGKAGWNTGGKTYGVRRVVKAQHDPVSNSPKVRWEISLTANRH